MSFKRINNITGWIVCIIACAVYIMTMEATGSLWDCGEFASSAYKLQVPHSPGAPFFVLIGRLFMAPFGADSAATGINLMSALSSGFTILFLFWSITHFARKLVTKDGSELTNEKIYGIMAAGIVGALAYTFSDSFWYSAVEGEVYALSSFFTAVLFWAMLKWEQNIDVEHEQNIKGHFTKADRWIILIFFLAGLSIGVHLLNLLVIPAIVMIYYFKRYKVTKWGAFFAFLIGCVITGVVQKAMIQYTISWAGHLDVLFVNSFGMPFFSGFAFFFVLIAALIYFGLRMAIKKNWNFLKLGLWSFAFLMMGCFVSYFTTLVRSSANVALDMGNVDNPMSLNSYLAREQYGDWPILYGQDFTADVLRDESGNPDMADGGVTYVKSKDKYKEGGRKLSYQYASQDMHMFPRMWDQSNDQGHANYYASWAGIGKDQQGNWERSPTMGENIKFALSYQVGWMYMRYFLWNFAGKQDDIQGINMGNVRDGNWKTGIGFWDNMRLGDQKTLPDSLKNNKANNKLFALPLILGLLGLVFQVLKDKRDFLIVGLLFFFTGLAIVFYLNQAGNQPRERDYAFVGSFYAFAIWIGLGVLYVKELFTAFIKNRMMAGLVAGGLCLLAVPVLMASQEWNDHDRSHKTLARDLAIDYLESCAPNAILITFGDNDTYPLWYAQEVQGIRKDIRVINSSLLGTDWYINQLRYKVNDSDPIDAIWSAEQIEGSNRDVIYSTEMIYGNNATFLNKYRTKAGLAGTDPAQPMDLYNMMKDFAGSDDPNKVEQGRDGNVLNVFPSKKVSIPVDINLVRQNGTVNADDSVASQVVFDIPKNALVKNDAAILNIIAANKWKRPIYFTSQGAADLGFRAYVRQDGLTYRFVPVLGSQVNDVWAYDKMMSVFKSGSADKPGVYFDEENRRHLNSIRMAYTTAAMDMAEKGKKEEAKKMLNKVDKMMLEENFPYGMVSRDQQHNYISLLMLQATYLAGDTVLAGKITKSLKKDLEQQQAYYAALDDDKLSSFDYVDSQGRKDGDKNAVDQFLMRILQLEQQQKGQAGLPPEIPGQINNQPPVPKAADTSKK
ncbi:MAG: DUF2723 domain-containing protein [Ferruginibacter sp.]